MSRATVAHGEFERKPNGDYECRGKDGTFLIWHEGQYWKARYWTDAVDKNGKHIEHYLLPRKMRFRDAIWACKMDIHWIGKKKTP